MEEKTTIKKDTVPSNTVSEDKKEQDTAGVWDEDEKKYKGYKPTKGITPSWNPFDPEKRKKRVTIREKKFLMVLSTTGSLQEAYKAAYTVKDYGDKKLQSARVGALANQVLRRLKGKAPELVAALTFEDITPDFVKKEMLKLYNKDEASIHEKTRLLELMGKTQAMFTDKKVIDARIEEVMNDIYQESDDDFPMKDERKGRIEIEEDNNK